MPYSGSANFDPKSLYPLEHFVVMVPKAMQFTAASSSTGFKMINYPNEPDASVQVASNTRPGQNLAFKVSGEGMLESQQESGAQGGGEGSKALRPDLAHPSPAAVPVGDRATDRCARSIAKVPLVDFRWVRRSPSDRRFLRGIPPTVRCTRLEAPKDGSFPASRNARGRRLRACQRRRSGIHSRRKLQRAPLPC